MPLNIIDRRCTVNVQSIPRGYAFQYQGKTYRRSTQEGLHDFFLKHTSFDTVQLRFPNQKYYLHFMLNESEKFTTKKALRSVLSQESQGAWIEEKNDKQRYFLDKGWVFSKIEEVSGEEFFSNQPSTLAQKVVSFVGTVALGVLALRSQVPRRTSPPSSVGFISGALFQPVSVFAQMPAFGEFRVINLSNSYQLNPAIAGLREGGFVAAQNFNNDVYAQIYNVSGLPLGSTFPLNTNTTGSQQSVALAGLIGGEFFATWWGSQNGNPDIFGQRFNYSRYMLGSEIGINLNITNGQDSPSIAELEGGGFVVVWESYQNGVNDADIYAKIYSSVGLPIGPEFRVNTNTTNHQSNPKVAKLKQGNFVVIWESKENGINWIVYGQKFNATGFPIENVFRVNTNVTSTTPSYPALTELSDGGFVVAWGGYQNGNGDIYGQIYNSSGPRVGSEFLINSNTTGYQSNPALTGLLNGSFVAAWYGIPSGVNANIYALRFNSSGVPLGVEFQINTNTTNGVQPPILASLSDGGFIAAWEDHRNGPSLYAKRYDANGAEIVDQPAITAPSTPLPSPQFVPSSNSNLLTPTSSFIVTLSSTQLSPNLSSISDLSLSSSQQSQSIQQISSTSVQTTSQFQSLTSYSSSSSSSTLTLSTSLPTTVLVSSSSSPQSSATFLSITTLSYETTYSITANGLNIGSFIFQGGIGLINVTQSNTIMLNIDAVSVGETFTLFTIPSGQEGEFQAIELVGVSCQSFESQIVQEGESQAYQVVFQGTTCALSTRPVAEFFPTSVLRV